jgi:hypothetical protein
MNDPLDLRITRTLGETIMPDPHLKVRVMSTLQATAMRPVRLPGLRIALTAAGLTLFAMNVATISPGIVFLALVAGPLCAVLVGGDL